MSIWGKIIGGATGFALGGPLGALLGGIAGHAVDRLRDAAPGQASTDATQQVAFTIGVIALGAKMAKADGLVTRDEVDAFKEVFHVPPEEEQNVRRLFNQARRATAGYEDYARQIARMFVNRPGVLEDLIDGLFHIAMADGVLHPGEADYLHNVAAIFGLTDTEFDRILAAHLGVEKADPYAILGIEPDISDDDLKKAYRRLVRENHPDALVARGVPEEFVEMANDKLASINAAYDRIVAERTARSDAVGVQAAGS